MKAGWENNTSIHSSEKEGRYMKESIYLHKLVLEVVVMNNLYTMEWEKHINSAILGHEVG